MVDLRACNGFYQIFITVNFQNIIETSLDSDTFKNAHVMSGQANILPVFLKNIKSAD
jgi:hypothetical protein